MQHPHRHRAELQAWGWQGDTGRAEADPSLTTSARVVFALTGGMGTKFTESLSSKGRPIAKLLALPAEKGKRSLL